MQLTRVSHLAKILIGIINWRFVRLKNCKLRQASLDQSLVKRYTEIDQISKTSKWSLKYDTEELFKKFDYKNEKWNYVRKLDKLFVLHSLGLFKGENVPYTPLTNNQVVYNESNLYKIRSKGLLKEWVYLTTYAHKFGNVRISIEIVFNTVFKEFQIAFRHISFFERLRFRIVDGDKLVFEVVTNGFFSKPISIKPFPLQTGVRYSFDISCLDGVYSFSKNGEVLMSIKDNEYEGSKGNVGVIFWDDKEKSNINADIYTCKLYTL